MKRTKIVATIGPKSESPEVLKKLSEAGVNVYRMNFSHGDHAEHGAKMDTIRKLGLPGAIMLDTKGPEIRTGQVNGEIPVKVGDKLVLTIDKGVYEETGKLSVNYKEFIDDVKVGTIIVIDSGIVKVEVKSIKGHDINCEVIMGSDKITSKRHINLMGQHVSLPTVTDADWDDIAFGVEKKVDLIALSFTRTAKDIEDVREFCAKRGHIPGIVAKIESVEAVENLEEIVQASDGIMVARGDLACEIPFAKVPQIQRQIIDLCNEYSKPVIVATQMLLSMIDNITPTRAEVSDVATAVYERADATMTSDETTKGVDPVNVIETMADILTVNEQEFINQPSESCTDDETINNELVKSAIKAADYVDGIDAIVVVTKSGKMAMQISNERPGYPVFAFTDNDLSKNKMEMLFGVYPTKIDFDSNDYEKTVQNAAKILKANKEYKIRKYILISYYKANGEKYPLITVRSL